MLIGLASILLIDKQRGNRDDFQIIFSKTFKVCTCCDTHFNDRFSLCLFLPAAYGMSSGPPERTSIIPIYITVLSFTVRGNALGPISKSRKINSFAGHLFFAYAPKITLVSLLVLVITKTNLAIQSQSDQAKFVMNWGQVDRSIWQAKKMAKSLLQLSMFQA